MKEATGQLSTGVSLLGIEFALTLLAVAFAICIPRTGSVLFSRTEAVLAQFARRRGLSVFICGITACALRLFILPLCPIPEPWTQDDFSFLLAADTFAHGRLTNPTPPMWVHFESFHISFQPTYMSMYFPLQGMVMAAGKVVAGHPWWGIWLSCGLMCSAICWMLQAWLPAGWALFGGMLAVLRFALFSYWINSYTGAAALAALGGALVLGALPRIRSHFRARDFFWLGLGMAILANTRPFEGLLICGPALAILAWHFVRGPRPSALVFLMRTAPAILTLAAAIVFIAYYDSRVFKNPFALPYTVNRQTYAIAPHFLWQSPRSEPVYRHRIFRDFYAGLSVDSEMSYFREETGSATHLLRSGIKKLIPGAVFYLGFAMITPLIMLPWALRDRRLWPLIIMAIVFVAGLATESFFLPHYFAPATALLYAILLQCMRHLRVWGKAGLLLVRATPVICIGLASLRVSAQSMHIMLGPKHFITSFWYGTAPVGLERARVLKELQRLPGQQLAIIAYSPDYMLNDWVYNSADIDRSKVVWARQMDPVSDRELLNYYKNRTAWLIETSYTPVRISLYPATPSQTALRWHEAPISREANRKQND